jgi:hypothetical protein
VLNIRAQAEIFYTIYDTYEGVCEEKNISPTLKKERYTCKASQSSYILIKTTGTSNIPCADATGYQGVVSKRPKLTSAGPFSCGADVAKARTLSEKLKTAVAKRHDWSKDKNHKYNQQVFWELRGESYSWKYDKNKGSYKGICKRKDLAGGYMQMMKKDGLKNIECGDSPSWFYIKATLPNGTAFCLNRNDKNNNDSTTDMKNCAQITGGTFTNVVKVR